jgi:hypothetical protein
MVQNIAGCRRAIDARALGILKPALTGRNVTVSVYL